MEHNPLEVLRDKFPDLAQWLQAICRYGKIEDFVIADYKQIKGYDAYDIRFDIYTKEHRYHISAYPRQTKKESGYLGCIAHARKPRAGEDWTRGNDLPDGEYSEKTWNEIVNAILAYELVKVVKLKEAQADEN